MTLQPDFGGPEDTPKFQFLGYVFGTPHESGYPLYSMLSGLFVRIPIATIAYRANLFSAVTAALACALTYRIARQVGSARWPALCAALAMAAGASFWQNAVFAEVYALAALMVALTTTLLLAWGAHAGIRRLLWAVAAFGAGLGNHLTLAGILPACILFVVLRDRRVLTPRVLAAAVAVLLLGMSQYGFIVLRTVQHAPYLESRADTLAGVIGVITAQNVAAKRFAFGPTAILFDHLPAVLAVIGRELGTAGVLLVVAGCIAAARRRNGAAAFLGGAGGGMLAIVLNLQGDLKGFVTPLMVLVWPMAALGITAIAARLHSRGVDRRLVAGAAIMAAVAMPLANVSANYVAADQSAATGEGRFYRAMFSQLPDRAAFVTEDYASDMAVRYYLLTGEAGPNRDIIRADLDSAAVRLHARDRRVFAFSRAATVLRAAGWHFERWDVAGPPLDDWLRALPRGTLIVGASAYAMAPFDPARIGHANVRSTERPRAFEAFALISRGPGATWRRDDNAATLTVDAAALNASLKALPVPLIASADSGGARLELAGETVAQTGAGSVLGIFTPDGALMRALEFPDGRRPQVAFREAVYELKGENPCATLSTDAWTDLTPVLSAGSWLATLPAPGTVTIETVFADSRRLRAEGRELLAGDAIRVSAPVLNPDGSQTLVTELSRSGGARPVFRVALDQRPASVRARVRPGSALPSVTLCADRPVNSAFQDAAGLVAIRADFESASHFGVGWSDWERTATGRVRRGTSGAVLLVPLDASYRYRLWLDLATAGPASIDLIANDVVVGTCEVRTRNPCDIAWPPSSVRNGVNILKFTLQSTTRGDGTFVFRGARIARLTTK